MNVNVALPPPLAVFSARHGNADEAEVPLRIAVLSPISWRTPPRHYGPWELFASLLVEGLMGRGHHVRVCPTFD